jgi:GDP-L-fucose synthase
VAKIAGIEMCDSYRAQYGCNFISAMPTNLYGTNDNYHPENSHVLPALIRRIIFAKKNNDPVVAIWGTGTPRREFMHVDDLARACWYLADKNLGGELINIGTGLDIEISAFAKIMAEIVGFTGEIGFDSSRPDGSPRKLLDVSKVRALGWQHKIRLEDGLLATYKWFIDSLEKGEVRGY